MSKVPIAEVTVGHPPVRAQSCPHVAKRDVRHCPVADFSRCACEPSRSALLSLRTCTAAWEMIEEGGTAESAPHLRADEASISHELWKRTSGLYARRVVGRRWYTEADVGPSLLLGRHDVCYAEIAVIADRGLPGIGSLNWSGAVHSRTDVAAELNAPRYATLEMR